jgi:hypothetical protein
MMPQGGDAALPLDFAAEFSHYSHFFSFRLFTKRSRKRRARQHRFLVSDGPASTGS